LIKILVPTKILFVIVTEDKYVERGLGSTTTSLWPVFIDVTQADVQVTLA